MLQPNWCHCVGQLVGGRRVPCDNCPLAAGTGLNAKLRQRNLELKNQRENARLAAENARLER